MDKLSAYKILNLEYNASNEEIKEAYARLSKEYHPEENPEEFQRIHDAYVTLARRGRNSSFVVYSQIHTSATKEDEIKNDFVFQEENEEQPEYDFEYAIELAKEKDKLQRKIFSMLRKGLCYSGVEYYVKEFFVEENYELLNEAEFVNELCNIIEKYEEIDEESYKFLMDYYGKRDEERLEKVLKTALEKKINKPGAEFGPLILLLMMGWIFLLIFYPLWAYFSLLGLFAIFIIYAIIKANFSKNNIKSNK